jgi:hypothetical protein
MEIRESFKDALQNTKRIPFNSLRSLYAQSENVNVVPVRLSVNYSTDLNGF